MNETRRKPTRRTCSVPDKVLCDVMVSHAMPGADLGFLEGGGGSGPSKGKPEGEDDSEEKKKRKRADSPPAMRSEGHLRHANIFVYFLCLFERNNIPV